MRIANSFLGMRHACIRAEKFLSTKDTYCIAMASWSVLAETHTIGERNEHSRTRIKAFDPG
jgi:hypothetical protein